MAQPSPAPVPSRVGLTLPAAVADRQPGHHAARPPAAPRRSSIAVRYAGVERHRVGVLARRCSPTATGSAATASSAPARATALLTPLAMPACSSGAAASTVAVSGATISASPRPNTIDAREHVVHVGDVRADPEQQQRRRPPSPAVRRSSGSAGRSACPAGRRARRAAACSRVIGTIASPAASAP